jgi:hypothetical protein
MLTESTTDELLVMAYTQSGILRAKAFASRK